MATAMGDKPAAAARVIAVTSASPARQPDSSGPGSKKIVPKRVGLPASATYCAAPA